MDTSPPAKVVLISVDDLRYDAVSKAGEEAIFEKYNFDSTRHETETIDSLWEGGIGFEYATSASSYTPPSHASLFTGRYPSEHGVKTFFNEMPKGMGTVAELAQDAGFETHAWIENIALDILEITKGFDRTVCPFETDDENLFEFVDQALSSQDPVFLFVHLFDVHKPYLYTTGGEERHDYNEVYPESLNDTLPNGLAASSMIDEAEREARETVENYDDLSFSLAEYAQYRSLDYLLRQRLEESVGEERFRYLIDLYLQGVEKFDRGRLNDLLKKIQSRLNDRYLLSLTSDHGEAKCEWRGRKDFMNSFNVTESATRVPWLFETDLEWIKEKTTDPETPVSHIDFYPTIAELLGEVTEDTGVQGQSLLEPISDDRTLFTESWYYEGGVDFFGNISEPGAGGLSEIAVREKSYKFVNVFEETGHTDGALYHVDDILEENNLDTKQQSERNRLKSHLESRLEEIDRTCDSDITDGDSDRLESRLRALGYLE